MTSVQSLAEMTASELVRRIAEGTVTSEALVAECLERIRDREDEVGAWSHLDAGRALRQAREFDGGGRGGPLGGVPFGVKDIIDTADEPTEWGTPIHEGRRAGRDAACVALSRKAGGILLGKTVTTEFANLHVGKTRNPRELARTPGGSSSGSAAAVADHMVPLAIGTQTTGSTIRPASFCGIFGYRPTWGEHRLHGIMEASGSIDTLGICARSVDDVALYRDVLAGIDPVPVAELDRPPRIAFCRTHLWQEVDPEVRSAIEDAAQRLASAGAIVEELDLPPQFGELTDAHRWITSFEFVRTLTWEIENHWDEISDTLRGGRISDGFACSFERYVSMLELAERCRLQMDEICADWDVLISAAAYGEAPVGDDAFHGADLYKMWTMLHVPALTIPVLHGANGMPVGLQLLAGRHRDRRLFAAANWAHRRLT